jgi:hypothetical protein
MSVTPVLVGTSEYSTTLYAARSSQVNFSKPNIFKCMEEENPTASRIDVSFCMRNASDEQLENQF